MANYFLLRDGLITDSSTYGMSIAALEKTDNNTGYTLTTGDSWSSVMSTTSGHIIDSIAVHLSSRAAIPQGTLSLSFSSRTLTPTTLGTYPISSFTSYDGSNNTVASYPLNWQLLKLSTPFTISTGTFRINLKTNYPDQLTLMGTSTVNGVNYDRMALLNTDIVAVSSVISKTKVAIVNDSPLSDETTSISLTGDGQIGVAVGHTCRIPDLGKFTIEGWWNISSSTVGTEAGLLAAIGTDIASVNSQDGWALIYTKSTSTVKFVRYNNKAIAFSTGEAAVTADQWNHIAVTCDGTFIRVFINGLISASVAATVVSYDTNQPYLWIGSLGTLNSAAKLFGKISNIRIVIDKCHYISNFTPPTASLPTSLDGLGDTAFLYKSPYSSYFIKNSLATNIHISSTLNGYSNETRTITADNFIASSLYVHNNAAFIFPNNASTDLNVVGANGLQATSSGTLQIGTSSNPIPPGITHTISLSNTHIGVSNGGRLDVYGAYKVPYGKLDLDIAAGDTFFLGYNSQLITDFSSWQVGDRAIILPNTIASNTTEIITIQSSLFAGCDFLPAAAFSHPRLGYLPSVANLTRNVKIGGLSYTKKGNIQARGAAVVNLNNAEFKYIDGSLSTGVDSNGLFSISGCTLSGNGTETLITPIDTEFATVFNGTNAYILSPANNSDFNIPAGTDFTFEVFIKPISNIASQVIAQYGNNPFNDLTVSDIAFGLGLNRGGSSKIEFKVRNGSDVYVSYLAASNTNIISNKWNHIAIVGYNGQLKMYIGGKLVATDTQNPWIYNSTYKLRIGVENGTNGGLTGFFNGKMSNLRFVNGTAIYTSNFTPPSDPLVEITGSGIATAILTLQDSPPVDNSYHNDTLIRNNITTELDSPFGNKYLNVNISNNVFLRTQYGIYLDNVTSDNNTISNNLILSSKKAGIYINDGLKGNITFNNNMSVGPSPYGSYIENNTTGTKLNGIVNFNNTYGMAVSSAHVGQIDNVINTYNSRDGLIIDGTISQLNETTFSNITASNNKTLGFRVTGNPINHLQPISLNINRLVANDNLGGGFEGYCITGNLSSLELNHNGVYGMKTSIGNYNTTFDGITALMNNTAGISASVGILSGICYYPILIDKANLGKADPASTFGAGIILDSTKFSQFIVNNSTIKGGTFDFQLKTSNDIIEGSYLISKTTVSNTPVGLGITPANYQSDTYKATGFAFTNMNNTSGYHITYLAAGQRFSDTGIFATLADAPSERLTPSSNSIKLKSGSKFVALNAGDFTSIKVYVRKSNASNGAGNTYNGTAPRLMLRSAPHMGIPADIVMAQLNTAPDTFQLLGATTTTVTDSGVLEFYVDCDGTQGWINIDNWSAT